MLLWPQPPLFQFGVDFNLDASRDLQEFCFALTTETVIDRVRPSGGRLLACTVTVCDLVTGYRVDQCCTVSAEPPWQAAELDYIAGTYGGRRRPAKFLCLFLKLLQIQPDEASRPHKFGRSVECADRVAILTSNCSGQISICGIEGTLVERKWSWSTSSSRT